MVEDKLVEAIEKYLKPLGVKATEMRVKYEGKIPPDVDRVLDQISVASDFINALTQNR